MRGFVGSTDAQVCRSAERKCYLWKTSMPPPGAFLLNEHQDHLNQENLNVPRRVTHLTDSIQRKVNS